MAKRGPKDRSHLFKPGQSGNPGGRKKDPAALYLLKKMSKDAWAEKVVELINRGNTIAMTIYANYVFGKPQESVTISGGLSLYEEGANEAARVAQEAGRRALLAEIRKLTGAKK